MGGGRKTRLKKIVEVRKQDFAYAITKAQISCVVTAQLISAFLFSLH